MRWPQERLRRAADAVTEYLRHEPMVLDSTIISGIALSAAVENVDDRGLVRGSDGSAASPYARPGTEGLARADGSPSQSTRRTRGLPRYSAITDPSAITTGTIQGN
jgi:hypothetical protein